MMLACGHLMPSSRLPSMPLSCTCLASTRPHTSRPRHHSPTLSTRHPATSQSPPARHPNSSSLATPLQAHTRPPPVTTTHLPVVDQLVNNGGVVVDRVHTNGICYSRIVLEQATAAAAAAAGALCTTAQAAAQATAGRGAV